MAHIFISYAHADQVYARKLADYLLANGFDVWIDDRIDFGSRWIRAIFKAIDDCGAFIVIMSPRAFEREMVENERLYAKKQNKPVFPLLLEGDSFPDLGSTQYYDVRGGKLPEKNFLERLASFAPRSQTQGQDVVTGFSKQLKEPIRRDVSQTTSFGLLDDQILFTRNFANKDECNWQGIGGQVFALKGSPLLNMRVRVVGDGGTEKFAISGSNILYGEAGWEIPLNSYLTNNSYLIELYSQEGTRTSPQFTLTFPSDCDSNLAIVVFEQRS
ncbi:MAG: toll/interleukin-1 receptor domain-containing protein [Chloroflexota bacterium]